MSDFASGAWGTAGTEDDALSPASYLLPVPMVEGNYESKSSLCLMEGK